jgi:hypothetical protein
MLIAGFIVFAGIYLLKKNKYLLKVGIRTTASVVSNRYSSKNINSDADHTTEGVYYPTIQFTTKNKQNILVELNTGRGSAAAIGTKKNIIYDPQFPQKAEVDNRFVLSILPWLVIGTGILGFLWILLKITKLIDVVN